MTNKEINETLSDLGIRPSDIILSDKFLANIADVVSMRHPKSKTSPEQWRYYYSQCMLGQYKYCNSRVADILEIGNTAYYMTAMQILSSDKLS